MENLTPMLQQYQKIKSQHEDCILFYRLGDFYEMFGNDACKASSILDVVLTSRDAGKSGRIPMCGIPYHAADNYIAKLIKAGLKVAICEQVEDPATAKGIVKRDVVRIITCGTYIDDSNYESRFILSLAFKEKKSALAFIDTASGTIQTNEFTSIVDLIQVIAKIPAYECIYPQEFDDKIKFIFKDPLLITKTISLTAFDDWCFNTEIAYKTLIEHFKTHNLRGFGIDNLETSISTSGALLEYLKRMHKKPLRHIDKISLYSDSDYVFISPSACYGLELDSFMQTIDYTLTSFGKRKLKNWIYQPLKNCKTILKRQNAIKLLKENPNILNNLEKTLKNTPDIEKSISRISCGTNSPKDLLALRNTLLKQPELETILEHIAKENDIFKIKPLEKLREFLAKAINPEIPLSHPEGKVINKGYDKQLDELRDIQENGREWLKNLQTQEIKRSGINSLKIGFNQVFGYYIEISKSNLDHVPSDYIRRQTLANAERFITPGLKEFEEKMFTADANVLKIENNLLEEIYKIILDNSSDLHSFSQELASLDVLHSLTILSQQDNFIAPIISEDFEINIKDGRHPVVEKYVNNAFIPNDTLLDCQNNHLIIITGPNMAGKSTFIRQTAILVILAQMGSFIPASSANIGVVDKIFTRIGAHDEIAKGQSTFMVEMSETAGILNNLSPKSLVILDEIGRGTSTFDGLSLAWAISEFLAKTKVRTLFATHFHELTALEEEFSGVKNYNVSVKEWNDEVIFLHKILPGGTDDSYGIYVAKLAGVPKEIVQRSKQILSRLEISGNLQEKIRSKKNLEEQLSLFSSDNRSDILKEIKKELFGLDLNSITPIEALNKLQKLKEKIQDNE